MTIEIPDEVWREAVEAARAAVATHAELVRVWPQYAEIGGGAPPPIVADACDADYHAMRRSERARDAVMRAMLALLEPLP